MLGKQDKKELQNWIKISVILSAIFIVAVNVNI